MLKNIVVVAGAINILYPQIYVTKSACSINPVVLFPKQNVRDNSCLLVN